MNKKHRKLKKHKNIKTQDLSNSFFNKDSIIYILLFIAVTFVFIARIHLLSFPFERDEGEYALMGKLILDGHAPYTLAYNMKFPGTYYMYALIMTVFGKSIIGVHLGLAFISIFSMLLLFYISKNFVSKIGAVITSATFGIMGTSWTLLGQAAHATHFVTFYALLGIASTFWIYKNKKQNILLYLIPGILFSFSFICKQTGLFFIFIGYTIIIIKYYKTEKNITIIKKLAIFTTGFAVPIIAMFTYFYLFGDFNKFWFWTIEYLQKYGTQIPVSEAFNVFKFSLNSITSNYSSSGYIALWILSLIGIPFIFINKTSKNNKILIISFVFFSLLTIIPGFNFRGHYFITLLPAIGLLVAVFFDYFNNFLINKINRPNLLFITIFIFFLVIYSGIKQNKDFLFNTDTKVSSKNIYGSNPFVESIKIAKFLKNNTTKTDKIAVIGSEPQIYFYADRYPATGYIYTYNLVEIHSFALQMQKEMAHEIEKNKPKYILFIDISLSWLTRPNSEKYIFTWAKQYLDKNYKIIGLIDLVQNKFSSLKVREQLINYQPQSKNVVFIYERVTTNNP